MKIKVSGTNMEVGDALTQYVEEHMQKEVKKYFENAIDAQVHFSKETPHIVKALITVNEGVKGGITVKSNADAGDAYGAFNEALQKAAKQLRRYKDRIKNYRRQGGGLKSTQPNYEIFDATKYIINGQDIEIEENVETNPEIIAEKSTGIQILTINEAVMAMDLADLPALVFTNFETGNINVIYHRKDGRISWIDTKKS